jgi:hypothetical protein
LHHESRSGRPQNWFSWYFTSVMLWKKKIIFSVSLLTRSRSWVTPHTAILDHLRDSLGIKFLFHLQWISHQLTKILGTDKNLEMLGVDTVTRRHRCDESWSRFSPRNWKSFPATGQIGADGLWRKNRDNYHKSM